MKVSYVNFWPQTTIIDFWLFNFCKTIFNDVELVHYSKNPDILFCSCFGPLKNVKKINAKIKVFFTGENVNRESYEEYSNELALESIFDIRLGFHFNDIKNNKLRLPLWLTFYNFFTINNSENFITNITTKHDKNIKKKQVLGSLICRHDNGGQRTKIMNELSKYGAVLSGGSFNNNIGKKIKIGWDEKIDFLKLSIFNICPENSSSKGYCTEKLFHSFEAGCIPLYWGNDLPEPGLIERNSYIFVNMENDTIRKRQIEKAVKDGNHLIQKKIFTSQSPYIIDSYYSNLKWQLKEKLNITETQKIYGISYSSRDFKSRENKINIQGINSNLFHKFKCFTEKDIDNEFKEKLGDVWYKSKRGGGYWAWKVFIIYKKLNEMKENDVLVYVDSGCSINITDKSKKRFNEYIEMVNNHWTGFLRFRLGENCKEKLYNNKYFLDFFQKRFNCDVNNYIEDSQLLAGILIMRKTKFVMDFFNEVLKMIYENPNIISDLYTSPNENHRHDQSVMSILYKHMNGDLIIEDETWFSGTGGYGAFGGSKSKEYPIWATRYRN